MTSVTQSASNAWFALAYLRCKSQGQHQNLEGLSVQIGSAQGIVVAIPFATRSFPTDRGPQTNNPVSASKPPDVLQG